MKTIHNIEVYENLQEIIAPKHSCLVVWDVQNGLVERIFNKDEFIGSLKNLIAGLRGKMPIVYTRITPPPKNFMSSWQYFSSMRRFGVKEPKDLPEFMSTGSPQREIHNAVKPQNIDIVLDKPSASIFIGTYFENMMRNINITTIIFTGIATEMGIESSARDAANRGFYPVIVSDCVSSMNQEAHGGSLSNMKQLFVVENSKNILNAVT